VRPEMNQKKKGKNQRNRKSLLNASCLIQQVFPGHHRPPSTGVPWGRSKGTAPSHLEGNMSTATWAICPNV
jgi:hypothetical protein